jgi:hypothetical protein
MIRTMWGEITPAERLRSVTRRGVSDHLLASEAADALAAFAAEPASLVVACRRVLAHHCAHGPLWWVCARVLAAPDPAAAARETARMLENDRTADRLAACLPLLEDDELVAVIGWSHAIDAALAERADIAAVALRVEGADPTGPLRQRRTERAVRVVDPWDPTLERVARLLVAADAIGSGHALVPAGTAAAIDELRASVREIWLVGGVGRVLPARLFDVAAAAVTAAPDALLRGSYHASSELLDLQRVDRIAGPRGLDATIDATARPDCPVVPELLRPL